MTDDIQFCTLAQGLQFPEGWRTAGKAHDYVSGSIQRVDLATGAATILYDRCNGRHLRGPNDIVFDSQGGFWFTDLGKTDAEGHSHGALYYALTDGSLHTRVVELFLSPNGCGLSPDESMIYVADTIFSRLFAFPLEAPGRIRGHVPAASDSPMMGVLPFQTVYGPLPGYQMYDSLAVEADGRVCVATLQSGAITIVNPAVAPGAPGSIEQVAGDDKVTTNICFGGADMRDAFVTAASTGRLLVTRWPRPGLRLAFNG